MPPSIPEKGGALVRYGEKNSAYKHGGAIRGERPPEYGIWKAIRMRCAGRSKKDANDYLGRGIAVCDRWNDYAAFIADMGPRPSSEHSIDRIDNDKGYSPDNCRWATKEEQARNKRNNVLATINGETKTLVEWTKERGLNYGFVHQRINKLGWSPEKAILTPRIQAGRRSA